MTGSQVRSVPWAPIQGEGAGGVSARRENDGIAHFGRIRQRGAASWPENASPPR